MATTKKVNKNKDLGAIQAYLLANSRGKDLPKLNDEDFVQSVVKEMESIKPVVLSVVDNGINQQTDIDNALIDELKEDTMEEMDLESIIMEYIFTDEGYNEPEPEFSDFASKKDFVIAYNAWEESQTEFNTKSKERIKERFISLFEPIIDKFIIGLDLQGLYYTQEKGLVLSGKVNTQVLTEKPHGRKGETVEVQYNMDGNTWTGRGMFPKAYMEKALQELPKWTEEKVRGAFSNKYKENGFTEEDHNKVRAIFKPYYVGVNN